MSHILKTTVLETFLERVKQTPHAPAFRSKNNQKWNTLSFKEFYDKVCRLSFSFLKCGIQKGTHVGIFSKTRFEWVWSDIALISIRAVTVPIHSTSTSNDLTFLIRHSDCEVILLENEEQLQQILAITDSLPLLKTILIFDSIDLKKYNHLKIKNIFSLNELLSEYFQKDYIDDEFLISSIRSIEVSDPFTLAYTSGATGDPKGVILTHANLHSVLEDCLECFGKMIKSPDKGEGEELLTFLPLSHIIGKLEIMSMFVFGWRITFAESLQKLDDNLTEIKPTILFAVPRIFDRAYEKINEALIHSSWTEKKAFRAGLYTSQKLNQLILTKEIIPSWIKITVPYFRKLILKRVHDAFGGNLKFVICGGAPLSKEKGEYFSALGIHIFEGYGLTETCAPIALNTFSNTLFGSVGKALPEVELRIEEDGEICVRSRKCFKEYYKNEDATREVIKDGWFFTGDVGFLDPNGFLHITDRKKDLIILSGGKNIAPQKIENELKKCSPLIEDVIVVGDSEKSLAALITLSDEDLQRFVKTKSILVHDKFQIYKHPKVLTEIQKAIDQLNKQLTKLERVKHFLVLPEPFSQKKGELSVSLKVRRTRIISKYHNEIKALFSNH